MNIALIGGMGTGKTTLSAEIQKEMPVQYIYMSQITVRIPLAILPTHPDLFSYDREKYIETIIANRDIPQHTATRTELNDIGQQVVKSHGLEITAEIALRIARGHTIFDNVSYEATRYLKDKGVYVIGLHCDFETQLKRRQTNQKDIDPTEHHALSNLILETEELLKAKESIKIADATFNTDITTTQEIASFATRILRR